MKRRRRRPYWLARGSVVCCACRHAFVAEASFHGRACDRPVCGECVLVDPGTGEVLCALCREAEMGVA